MQSQQKPIYKLYVITSCCMWIFVGHKTSRISTKIRNKYNNGGVHKTKARDQNASIQQLHQKATNKWRHFKIYFSIITKWKHATNTFKKMSNTKTQKREHIKITDKNPNYFEKNTTGKKIEKEKWKVKQKVSSKKDLKNKKLKATVTIK